MQCWTRAQPEEGVAQENKRAAAPKAGVAPHTHSLHRGEADSEGMLRARLSGRLDLGNRDRVAQLSLSLRGMRVVIPTWEQQKLPAPPGNHHLQLLLTAQISPSSAPSPQQPLTPTPPPDSARASLGQKQPRQLLVLVME